jgi:hypothetical protein
LLSIAARAANLRSTCDVERRAPECSAHRFRAGTPHVGQGTETVCLGVSAPFFIVTECDYYESRICSILDKYRCNRRFSPLRSLFRQQGFDVSSQSVKILFGYHRLYPSRLSLFRPYSFSGDCKKNNGCADHSGAKLAGSLKTVHVGNSKVQNDQIGAEILQFLKGIQAVYRFATNWKTRFSLQEMTDCSEDDFGGFLRLSWFTSFSIPQS